ncbi:MAG: type II toxin-antitoxin system YafQ family toxin [Patescibacteria group bacterium]
MGDETWEEILFSGRNDERHLEKLRSYTLKPTKRFRKDVRRLKRANVDLRKMERVLQILASGRALPANYRDHALHGPLAGRRECHIAPDWLLLYRKDDDRLLLLLLRTGDHRRALGVE